MGLFDDLPDAGTAPATAGGLFDDLPDAVGTTDYLAEIGKGTARGLVKTLATIPQGVAVAQSADQAEVTRIEDGLARLKTMPYDEANAFVQSIKPSAGISPVAALSYGAAARALWNGKAADADGYLKTARQWANSQDIKDTELYKAGADIQQRVQADIPQDTRFKGSWTTDLSEGLGSTGAFIGAAPLGALGIAGTGALAGMAGQYDQARQTIDAGQFDPSLGDPNEQARRAALMGSVGGASEAVPLQMLIHQIPNMIPGLRKVAGSPSWQQATRTLGRIGAQVLEEGGQEAFQQWYQNVINRLYLDPNQSDWESVGRNAVIGGLIGGGMQTGVEAASAGKDAMSALTQGPPTTTQTQAPGGVTTVIKTRGTVPPPTPTPAQPRQEPRLFDDLPDVQNVQNVQPPEDLQQLQQLQRPVVDPGDALLAGAGWSPEQIGMMSAPERDQAIQEAQDAGVTPAETLAPGAPEPGTAAMAPRGTRKTVAPIATEADLEAVRPVVNAQPSDAQKEAGNYQKAHVRLHGFDISIENPRGSTRSGTDPDTGEAWQSPALPADYGYIKSTKGADGDHLDVYIGPQPDSDRVFVIDQLDRKGRFDEHKVIFATPDAETAARLYLDSFDSFDPSRIGAITEMSAAEFKTWSAKPRLTKRPLGNIAAPGAVPMAPREARMDPAKADSALSQYLSGREPLTAEGLATRGGMSVKDAGKALQRAALAGRIMQGRNGQWRRLPSRVKPVSLLSFVASIGGIQDVTGELAGMDLPKMTEYGPPSRRNGLHPDKVLEAAVEAGYLRDPGRDNGTARQLSIRDLYDAIDREVRGAKVYTEQDQPAADGIEAQRKNEGIDPEWRPMHPMVQRYGQDAWDKAQAFLAENGSSEESWAYDEIANATRLISEGMQADAAFERAAFLHVETLGEDLEDIDPALSAAFRRNDADAMTAFEPPPFPDVEPVPNAEQPARSQEASPGVQPAGQEGVDGAGPPEDAGAGAQVPSAGPRGGEEGQGGSAPAAVAPQTEQPAPKPNSVSAKPNSATEPPKSAYPANPSNLEQAIFDLPSGLIRQIGNELGVKQSGRGKVGFVEAINDNPRADVLKAYLKVTGTGQPAAVTPTSKGDTLADLPSSYSGTVPDRPQTKKRLQLDHEQALETYVYNVNLYNSEASSWDAAKVERYNGVIMEYHKALKAATDRLEQHNVPMSKKAANTRLPQWDRIKPAVPQIEPGADNKPQMVIPGAEQLTPEQATAAAAKEKAKKELEIRRKQSKLRKGGQLSVEDQKDGMFAASEPAQTDLVEQAVSKPSSKIEDFGEKITGARKDAVRDIVKSLDDDVDLTVEPLSKTFPQPDYVKLAESGVDRKALALVAMFRAKIPSRPQKPFRVAQWAEKVKLLRGFALHLLDGTVTPERTIEKIRDEMPILSGIANTAEVIAELEPRLLPFAAQYTIRSSQISMLNGVSYNPAKRMYLLESEKQRWTNVQADTLADIKQPALDFIRRKAEAELGADGEGKPRRTPLLIYSDRFTKDVFIGFKGVAGVIRLKTGFATAKEARTFIAEHADDLQQQIDQMREGPDLRRASNMPRSGPARRTGDVAPQQFQEAFGFRGVQFGNYVEDDRRQSDLNEAFDALMDLSTVLGVPPQAISLGGRLGLAFGARGHGGKNAAAAHYEPGQIVINLTKHAGPGSLAHEWLHALDHHFARQATGKDGRAYASEAKEQGALREPVWLAWRNIQRTLSRGDFAKRSAKLDEARSKPYFSTTIEKAARAFEKYIVDRLGESQTNNDYLANIEASSGAYPTDNEMAEQGIRKAYDDLFSAVEVKWSDDRKQAVLSSRGKASEPQPRSRAIPRSASVTTVYTSTDVLTQHPDYAAAKAGSLEATARLIPDIVTPQYLRDAAAAFGNDAVFVAVHAEEAGGRNKIPIGFASYLQSHLGGTVDDSIVQVAKAYHTGASPIERLISRPIFDGTVRPGARYVVVDDVTVLGGTIAELSDFIQSRGGTVAGVATIANHSRNGVRGLAAALPAQVRDIERRFGHEIRTDLGVAPEGLTYDEAFYLRNFPDADALRGRIAAARLKRQQRLLSKGIRQERLNAAGNPTSRSKADTRAPIFYSGLLRAVENLKQEKAPAAQWLGTIRNQPGVKPEEIAWLGLDDWLGHQTGAVTKAQIADFVRANQVQVSEVQEGAPIEPADIAAKRTRFQELNDIDDGVGPYRGRRRDLTSDEADEMRRLSMDLSTAPNPWLTSTPGEFETYQLPGGENYRELLLTLPERPNINTNTIWSWQYRAEGGTALTRQDAQARVIEAARRPGLTFGRQSAPTDEQIFAEARIEPTQDQSDNAGPNYRSPHWDEPNVVAHVRFNERTDAEGKKVLFIEEIQSDWMQQGRKHGFRGQRIPANVSDALIEWGKAKSAKYGNGIDITTAQQAIDNYGVVEAQQVADKFDYQIKAGSQAVPDAPFKTTWPELAMKRMVRWAAENGFDRIAWTPGSVQIERYWGNQSVSDAVDRFKEIAKPQSVRELAENIFGREMAASMPLQSVDGGMLSVMQHDQVRRNIIVNTPVDVMDLLRAHQLSPEQLFSNDRVVADRLSVDSRRRVIAGILSASRLTGASIRAKLGALKPGGSDVEILPALRASQLNSREVAGLLSPQSIFHLGTGRAPELAAATGAGAEPLPGGEGGVLNGKVPAAELANLLNAHVTIKYGRDALLRQGFEAPPGQGMVGFYDKILVDTARKLGKKFGATVGKTIIDNQGGEFPWVVRDVTDDGAGRIVDTFPTEAAAREYMAIEDGGHELAFEPTDLPMHSLDIPQAMRDAAMQGQPLFRQTRNRFRFILNQKQAAQLTAEINQIAADLLGHHLVGVETRDTLEADFTADEDAVFDPNTRLIWVALRGTQDPRLAVRHETIHALRHAGVFTAKEWAVLTRVAQSHWMHEFNIRERYESLYRQRFDLKPDQIEELLIEEAIAEAFAEHMSARPQNEALITRIFNRVLRFIEAVRNLLAGHGYTTADQVLQEVETGAVGRRRAGQGQARQFPLSARQDSLPQAPLSSRGRLRPPRNPATGSFDAPHDERVMRALNDTTDTLLGRLKRAGKAFAIEGVRKLQDREVDLLRTQNAITKASGPIAESKDAYLAASLYPGRAAQKDKDLVEDWIKPLTKDIAARGLTLREVDDFVRARHGLERNLVVGQLYKPGEQFHDAMSNPALKGASGLSEDEITQILDGFQNSGKLADLEAVGDKIVALNGRSLRAELAEGLIDQELYDQLTTQYRYYVPLRGWDEATSDAFPDAPRTGSRFDIRGKEHQQAFGRTTLSDSPLAFSILQARQAIIRIENNRVAKRFLRLAQANPNEAFWQVERRDLKKVIDKGTGLVRRVYDRGSTQAENVFAAKVGGQTFHVTLHQDGLLRAMKGIGTANMHSAVVFFHKINRYLAAIKTSLDPEFIFRNFLRDLQHAGIVLQEEKQKGLVADVLKSIPQATAGMNRMLNGDLSTHWARVAREFADAGGKVGFMDRGDIDAEKRNLDRLMKSATGGAGRKTAEYLFEATFGRIERYNDDIENTLRLATYAGLRNRGVSKDKAAFVARELTVNFNRKGEWGPFINAFYLFFNASMQGGAQLAVRLKRSKRLRIVAAGIVGAALVQDIVNRMIAGDDDDDKNRYDKIPDDIKARFAIIMMPKWVEEKYGIPYFKWPLPLGWNIFHVIGTQAGHVLMGARTPLEGASNMVGAIGDAFNPLGSGGFVNWLAPTLMDPAIDLYANTDFWGDDIVPKTYDDTKPLAERYNQNVTPGAKMLTDTLSKATGGSPERPGSIDVSPEQVEYLWDFATGGVGRLLSRAWSTGDAIAGGDAWDAMKTPFVRVFVGQDSKYIDRDEYYQIKNAVEITQKELKGRTEDGDAAAVERVRRDHAPEVQMIKFVDKIEKRLAKLRKDARKITANDAMPDDAKKTALDGINAERDRLQQIVRKRWNQIQKTTNLEDAR